MKVDSQTTDIEYFTLAARVVKLSKVFLHVFKDLSSKLQRCMKRTYEFFYIFAMNTNDLKVFIITSENRTSADSFCNWYFKNEVIFVHIDLTNILCQVF